MSEYKSKLLDLVKDMSDEDFDTLVRRFDKLNNSVELFAAHLNSLGVGDPREEVQTKAEGLCESCANPCDQKQEGRLECKDFSEFIKERCLRCEYWDVETCMLNGTCQGAEHFLDKAGAMNV